MKSLGDSANGNGGPKPRIETVEDKFCLRLRLATAAKYAKPEDPKPRNSAL
jgi:hypothetical protein